MARMISRQEAAELLDCHPQTVTNWVEKGVINGHKVGGFLMLDRNSIEQYFDTLKDLADMEQKLMDMKSELHEKYKDLKATLDELRIVNQSSNSARLIFRENQMTMIHLLGEGLKDRELEILKRITKGDSLEAIGNEFGLTRGRVAQIGTRAASKISDISDFKKLVNENKNLQEENKRLNEQIVDLNTRLSKYESKIKLASTILEKPISDLLISVRTINALKSLHCETVGDVVKHEKADLMKARNFGKKCLKEIDDFVIEHGLHWGMRLDLMSAEELASINDKWKDKDGTPIIKIR